MALSFSKLLENMQRDAEENDRKAKEAIRAGLNLRTAGCGSFWDDFIQVCGNTQGMAELLGVPSHQIARWAGRIRECITKVNREDSEQNKNGKAVMISTGDGDTELANPNGADYPGSTPPDTKPMP